MHTSGWVDSTRTPPRTIATEPETTSCSPPANALESPQALNSKAVTNHMVQYHALGVLYHIKQKDRLAVAKLVQNQMKSSSLRSPYASCLLIRYASKVMDGDAESNSEMFDYLESCLRSEHEMVIYEAARAIVNLKNVTARELAPAVSVLQLFLSSPKPTNRFAAVRTLNKIAISHPNSLKGCNLDLENLITDTNRSIATLAITTLLKTGNEASLDRLLKQITSFISEIVDEFKVVVVNAIKSLCLKFPKKHAVTMGFLSSVLRDEGGFEYKKAVVETIVNIIENVPEAHETGLEHLCEFIEDCEFPSLLVSILHLLGEQGPRTASPRKYIRFVYNRLILENAKVRAAAISALARFGTQCESLRPSVLVLLKRSMVDTDDEVRDRATFCIELLEAEQPAMATKYILNSVPQSTKALESALMGYAEGDTDVAFDMKTVAIAVDEKPEMDEEMASALGESTAAPTTSADEYREQLAAVSAFDDFGPLFKSSKQASLTESETEYKVSFVKHMFENHCVLQFNLLNTLNDQILENVRVLVAPEELDEDDCIFVPAPMMKYDEPTVAYTAFEIDAADPSAVLEIKLDFVVKDTDPDTGDVDEDGYQDTYALDDVEISVSDYMIPVDKPNFAAAWKELDDAPGSVEETLELPNLKDIDDAVSKIMGILGMKACEKSDRVKAGKNTHVLYLAVSRPLSSPSFLYTGRLSVS
jgi:coatomer protein complex subunit gamma